MEQKKVHKGSKSSLMRLYRKMDYLHKKKVPILPALIMRYIRVIYSCDLALGCELADGVVLMHNGLGVVIHPKAKVGANTLIYQNVTIGGRNGKGVPIIGENVYIAPGAQIMGGVIIGDNSTIGANSVVVRDVAPGTTVVGIPAKPLASKA